MSLSRRLVHMNSILRQYIHTSLMAVYGIQLTVHQHWCQIGQNTLRYPIVTQLAGSCVTMPHWVNPQLLARECFIFPVRYCCVISFSVRGSLSRTSFRSGPWCFCMQRMPTLRITGDKSLPEPLVTHLTGTYVTMLKKLNSPVIAHGFVIFPVRYSVLYADFILRRHMGYFMINVYVPSSLLVVISWVGFWINKEATADRIALGKMAMKYTRPIKWLSHSYLKVEEHRWNVSRMAFL